MKLQIPSSASWYDTGSEDAILSLVGRGSTLPCRSWCPTELVETPMGRVRVYNSRSESYTAAARLLRAVRSAGRPSFVWVESVGKQDDIRSPYQASDPHIVEFQSALGETILENLCEVRYLVRVSDTATLESALHQHVAPFEQAKLYQVRAAILDQTLNTMSPLIVGDRDTLIGIGRDATMTEACIHLHDQAATRLVMQYFELLWNDRCAVTIRDAGGVSNSAIDLLRNGLLLRQALTS